MEYPDLVPAGVSPRTLNLLIFPKDDFLTANPSIAEVSNSGMLFLTVSGLDSVLPIASFKKIFSVNIENLWSSKTFKAFETSIFFLLFFVIPSFATFFF